MARFVHGTAGWSYRDWVGPFYPSGTPQSRYLELYAQRFPGVEVDSTYYRPPTVEMARTWATITPKDFLFSPKMTGEITHQRFLRDCDDLLTEYMRGIEPLQPKLASIVLQFPYYRRAEGVTLDLFLERLVPFLKRLPSGYSFAVEVRNKSFLKPPLLDALREHNAALVLVDHAWMPDPEEYPRYGDLVTGRHVPVRLIGDRRGIEKITKRWSELVLDRRARIRAWSRLIRQLLAREINVSAFANNHYAGHGPESAHQLALFVQRDES